MYVIVLFKRADCGVLKPVVLLQQCGEKVSFNVYDLRLAIV